MEKGSDLGWPGCSAFAWCCQSSEKHSAQRAELLGVIRALELSQDKRVKIYTNLTWSISTFQLMGSPKESEHRGTNTGTHVENKNLHTVEKAWNMHLGQFIIHNSKGKWWEGPGAEGETAEPHTAEWVLLKVIRWKWVETRWNWVVEQNGSLPKRSLFPSLRVILSLSFVPPLPLAP